VHTAHGRRQAIAAERPAHADASRHPGYGSPGGHVLQYHGARTDAGLVANGYVAPHFGAGAHEHAVADCRVALAGGFAGVAESPLVLAGDIVADYGSLADDDASAVVDEDAPSYACPGMDLDAGE